MIEAGLVDLQQVFLPYAQDAKGRTFYELMRELTSRFQDFDVVALADAFRFATLFFRITPKAFLFSRRWQDVLGIVEGRPIFQVGASAAII